MHKYLKAVLTQLGFDNRLERETPGTGIYRGSGVLVAILVSEYDKRYGADFVERYSPGNGHRALVALIARVKLQAGGPLIKSNGNLCESTMRLQYTQQ
ncbi:hypothetical protein GCM10028816_18690 [Spirosoma lituiforme]